MARAVPMSQVLEEALKSVRKGRLFRRVRIFQEWTAIAGEQNARMSRPVDLRGGTLTVRSEDAVRADQLKYFEADLLHKIEERVGTGYVQRIRFVVGELSAKRDRRGRTRRLRASAATTDAVEGLLDKPALGGKDGLKEDLRSLLTHLGGSKSGAGHRRGK